MPTPGTAAHDPRSVAFERGAVRLDGRSLTPDGVVRVARGGAAVALTADAAARNASAARALDTVLASGAPVYGVTTGVGALRTHEIPRAERGDSQVRLLRSHAGGGGDVLAPDLVRAAMVVRANQLGAGGAGVSPALLDALVAALNAGLTPVARELGSLGTGDLSVLAEIALALRGEGTARIGGEVADAGDALARAGLAAPALGPRDGIGFMSSNAATIGQSALVAHDAAGLLDAALAVAALSFAAADADPAVLDPRVHRARPHLGQVAVAERLRALLVARRERRHPLGRPVHDPYAFRCLPQVYGPAFTALERLAGVLEIELNAAAENALVVADDAVALPNGNFHGAVLALALDGLCAALAQTASLVAARVSALLDPTVTGLPPMLAERPGTESGAMVLEYTAHAAAAAVRALASPLSAQYVSVSGAVEAHGSLAGHAAARAADALERMADALAVELVVAVRTLRLRGETPAVARYAERLLAAAAAALTDELGERPHADDVARARRLITTPDRDGVEGRA